MVVELEQQEQLSLKMKKLEVNDQTPSRGSVVSGSGSFLFRNVTTSEWINYSK